MSARIPAVALAGILIAGCANTTAFIITADTMDTFEVGVEKMNAIYVKASAAKQLTAKQVEDFNVFQAKFQAVYPSAVAAWRLAVRTNDLGRKGDAETIILGLLSEAAPFATAVGTTLKDLGVLGAP